MENNNLIKVFFEYEQDGEQLSESMWAEGLSSNTFRLDNVPMSIYGISSDDVFEAEIVRESFQFKNVIKRGGHSTLRVAFSDLQEEVIRDYYKQIEMLGGYVERFTSQLIGIDIAPEVNLEALINFCKEGEELGLWEYEKAHIFEENN